MSQPDAYLDADGNLWERTSKGNYYSDGVNLSEAALAKYHGPLKAKWY